MSPTTTTAKIEINQGCKHNKNPKKHCIVLYCITPEILWTAHAFECAQGHHISIQGEHDGKQEHNTREPV